MVKVRNLKNNSGNEVKNQYVIHADNNVVFQSYDSTIAIYDENTTTLTIGKHWDYSTTTSKHLYRFLNCHCMLEICNKKQMQIAIDNGFSLTRYNKFPITVKYDDTLI